MKRRRESSMAISLDPRFPLVRGVAEADAIPVSNERGAQQARFGEGALQHPLRRVAAHVQAERAEPGAVAVDQRGRPELLLKAAQLTPRGRPLFEIDEVHGDPPLGEEAQRLAAILAALEAEDLDAHGLRLARSARSRNRSHAGQGTAGVPRGFVRPLWGP